MAKLVIDGGKKLGGEIKISGSKNSALSLIAASVIIPDLKLKNVPRIRDVDCMLEIVEHLGGEYCWVGENDLEIKTENLRPKALPSIARALRASVLFAGPLLARFGQAELPYPGGDVIGARPLNTHLSAFERFGVRAEPNKILKLKTNGLKAGRVVLEETSVTATENILMLAASIKDACEIRLAAAEPHVQDLCRLLEKSGVQVEGIGTTTLKTKGTKTPKPVEHSVIPDELEVSGFAALAAATRSEVSMSPVEPKFLDSVFLQLSKMNVNFSLKDNILQISPPKGPYKSFGIQAGLYPKLVTDHLPPFAVLATQAEGASLIHDWLFEARQSYLRELSKMGANIMIMDPHRALIMGPTPLYGKEVASYDIRSGMAMVIAALVAKGRTTISDIEHIDRGYENLEDRLRSIGADVKRVE